MAGPDVSVVVPTHNRADWLVPTLHTVLGQRAVDIEVIVVDDGSDGPGTADAIATLDDDRVRLLRHEVARGQYAARNWAATVATGPVLAFCDDDDLWAPDKLRRQLEALERAAADWAFGGAVDVDERNVVLDGAPPPAAEVVGREIERWNLVPAGASNVMVRSQTFERIGGFDPSLRHIGDWDLWLRLTRGGLPAVVDEPLVGYRQHGSSDTRSVRSILREVRSWSRRNRVAVDRGALLIYYGDIALADGRRILASTLYGRAALAGDRARAARRFRRRLRPRGPAVTSPYRDAAARWLADVPNR